MKALELLKNEFLNKEVKLLELDNKVLALVPAAKSIFDYNVYEMLENSFCYQNDYNLMSGYNFTFEVVKNTDNILDIIVKVIDIEII